MARRQCIYLLTQTVVISGWTAHLPFQMAGGFNLLPIGARDRSQVRTASRTLQCIDLLASGKIQVQPLISAKASLDEGAEWFARLYKREGNLMKVILQP